MSDPFISEIRMFGFGFAPRSWAQCDGQLLPINQNQSLFALLGTTYGGDGRASFALPDMRGRVPLSSSGSAQNPIGIKHGVEYVTLQADELAAHSHVMKGSTADANVNDFAGNVLAAGFDTRSGKGAVDMYGPATNLVTLSPNSVSTNGSGQPHYNWQPSAVVNFCIALAGVFPSRN